MGAPQVPKPRNLRVYAVWLRVADEDRREIDRMNTAIMSSMRVELRLSRGWRSLRALLSREETDLQPNTWATLLLYTLSGTLLGLALVHPRFAWCAWISVAAMAAALTWTRSNLVAFGGALLAHWLIRFVGLNWVQGMNEMILDFSPAEALAFLAVQSLVWALPIGCVIGLGYVVFRRRLAPCWWLPVAWGGGEALRFALIQVNIGDWLNTQWMVAPVLRALGRFGWWPTHYICLFAAACVGQAIATRARWPLLPSAMIGVCLLLLPPLPHRGEELLRGVAAVHTGSTLALPHRAPPGVDQGDQLELVIWPESAYTLRPFLVEGDGNGARIRPLLRDSQADHLIGLESTIPGRGRQNQVVAVTGEGVVLSSRAKKVLMPVAEKRYAGVGSDRFVPGDAPPLLEVAGRTIIPLICGEFLSRALIREGRRLGGELLVVVARDQMMVNDRAKRQLLAVQVVRSVEFGIPSVRASYGGWANFIGADGRVLARSGRSRNGFLRWDGAHGARDVDFWGVDIDAGPPVQRPPAEVAVLYSKDAQDFRTRCPEGTCRYYPLEEFRCPTQGAATVVIAGHGGAPTYLSHTPEEVADAVLCFSPELVVIDTCFGAMSELLLPLTKLDTLVVAAPFLLPTSGLDYMPEFFTSRVPWRRANAVVSAHGGSLLRWRTNRAELSAALARVEDMSADSLRNTLARRVPPQVKVSLSSAGDILVPFEWSRLRATNGNIGRFKRLHKRPERVVQEPARELP